VIHRCAAAQWAAGIRVALVWFVVSVRLNATQADVRGTSAARGLCDKALAEHTLSPISPVAITKPCAIIEALYE
jgi:hypothetical protein